jgi:sulfide-dependent adenosine diphosphate thiazole synthase
MSLQEDRISRSIVGGFARKFSESLSVDVAIVGAGPSGLVCACLLAKQGHDVALFERKLAPGGGIWGGAMLMNEIVVQEAVRPLLDEFGIRHRPADDGLLALDSVETAAALVYHAVHAGARIYNAMTVEDVVYKNDRVGGVVINWTPVLLQGMHVDPLTVMSRVVLDGTGHGATLTEKVAKKAGIRLNTSTGGLLGEKPMWADVGERATVENTREVYPGLFVSGMAANEVYGSARMGPIFGGMFLSGRRAAELIAAALRQPVG